MAEEFPIIGISTGKRHVADYPLPFQGAPVTYSEAVSMAGGVPVLIPHNLPPQPLRKLFERLDGIVLPGGGDVDPAAYRAETHPQIGGVDVERDQTEFLLARWAVDDDKPLFAICRGIQVLNVALGGTLIRDIPSEVPNALEHTRKPYDFGRIAHAVSLVPESALFRALGVAGETLNVNSLHHQAIHQPAQSLQVTARAPDGIIEGVEIPGRRFILGVQWHPEALVKEHPPMLSLFRSLVAAANAA
jgi:putative glutamine amidotransferase